MSEKEYQLFLHKNTTNKYNAIKSSFNNITFDSKMEMKLYQYLLCKYDNLILQPKFNLQPSFKDNFGKSIRAIDYIADFQIGDIVIDCKGFVTKDFKIKEKLFKFRYAELKLLIGTYKELVNLI